MRLFTALDSLQLKTRPHVFEQRHDEDDQNGESARREERERARCSSTLSHDSQLAENIS
jgi:hypothetical protein